MRLITKDLSNVPQDAPGMDQTRVKTPLGLDSPGGAHAYDQDDHDVQGSQDKISDHRIKCDELYCGLKCALLPHSSLRIYMCPLFSVCHCHRKVQVHPQAL